MRRFEFFPCLLFMFFFLTEKFSTRPRRRSLACLTRVLYYVARDHSRRKRATRASIFPNPYLSRSSVCDRANRWWWWWWRHTQRITKKTRHDSRRRLRRDLDKKANDASHVIAVLRSWAGRETRKKRDEQTIRWTSKNKSPDETYSH